MLNKNNLLVKGSFWTPIAPINHSIPIGVEDSNVSVGYVEVISVDRLKKEVIIRSEPAQPKDINSFLENYEIMRNPPKKISVSDYLSKTLGGFKNSLGKGSPKTKVMRSDLNKTSSQAEKPTPKVEPIPNPFEETVVIETTSPIKTDHLLVDTSHNNGKGQTYESDNNGKGQTYESDNTNPELKSVITLSKKSLNEFEEGETPDLSTAINLLKMFPDVKLNDYVKALVNEPTMLIVVEAIVKGAFEKKMKGDDKLL